VVGDVVNERVGSGVFEVDDDDGVVRRSGRFGRGVESEEVAVLGVVVYERLRGRRRLGRGSEWKRE